MDIRESDLQRGLMARVTLKVTPQLRGAEELLEKLYEVDRAVERAKELLMEASAMTLEVTADVESATDER